MKKWLVKWLMSKELRELAYNSPALVSSEEGVDKPEPKVRIGTMDVMNGKLLEVSTYQPKSHGPDWKTEYYILEEGRPLAEQIAVVMTMRGMGV